MMDVFNTRELALLIWVGIITILLIILPKAKGLRKSIGHVFAAFFAFKIQVMILLMLAYIAGVVYFLNSAGIWDFGQLKNTIIWTGSIAFMSFFKIKAVKNDRRFFKHAVLDNLKLLAIIEFVVGFHTLPLIAEFIILPIIIVIVATAAFAERDEKYAQVTNFLNGIMVFFGLFLVGYAIYMLFTNFNEFAREETLYDFIIPPLLTLTFLPFIFILMVYVSYETVSLSLRRSIKNPILRVFSKAVAMVVFNVRITLLERWASLLQFSDTDTYAGIWESVKRMLKIHKSEKNPERVDIKDGWSPYEAKEFLNSEGFETGFYNQSYHYWAANSQHVKLGDGIFYNRISFRVTGTENIAKSLQLTLTIEDNELANSAHEKLVNSGKKLFESATNVEFPDWLNHTLLQGIECEESISIFKVCVTKDEFQTNAFNGYDMTFTISNIL